MPKWFTWVRYLILAVVFFFLFGRKAKASEVAIEHFASDPLLKDQKDAFLLECKRPDWNEDDCLSAKQDIVRAADSVPLIDLSTFPKHFYILLEDVNLKALKGKIDIISKAIEAETLRRVVK